MLLKDEEILLAKHYFGVTLAVQPLINVQPSKEEE